MLDLEVVTDAATAATLLDPVRNRLLAELATPASAAALATRVGLTRQKVNYYLQALQERGLIEEAGKRTWGGLTERLFVASASSYVVSPEALGAIAADPGRSADRVSASYLIALAARMVREVGTLLAKARSSGKRLATLSIDTEIRFASAAARADFTRDVTEAIAAIAARYHDETAPDGRLHRVLLIAHPTAKEETPCH